MAYLVFDTETTGLPDWRQPAHAPGQPRLASWCMLAVDDDLEIERRWHGLVKPNGWVMPPEAAAINGLTNERLENEGVPVDVPLGIVVEAIAEGRVLVAHNLQFDTKIMRGELRRRDLPDIGMQASAGICTMRGLTDACGIPHPSRSGFKFPRLHEAGRILLGREFQHAHDAVADAKACLWLLRVMWTRGMLNCEAA